MQREIGGQVKMASIEESNERRRKCWHHNCKRRAIVEDWTGQAKCFKHWYFTLRWGGGNKRYYFKTTRLYWPKKIKQL